MEQVSGNLKGLKATLIRQLRDIYDITATDNKIMDAGLLETMADMTEKCEREIAVYINRRGKIINVSVGNDKTVELPDFDGRKSQNRLSGVICLHTHTSDNSMLSELDISSLKRNRYDLMIAIGVKDAVASEITIGVISGFDKSGNYLHEIAGTFSLEDFCHAIPGAQFIYLGGEKRLNSHLEVLIYRCAYELVNNAVKYADASVIRVQLMIDDGVMSLTVYDDGIGFDPAAISSGTGFDNIRSRISTYNGRLSIHSSPGNGTEVSIEIEKT